MCWMQEVESVKMGKLLSEYQGYPMLMGFITHHVSGKFKTKKRTFEIGKPLQKLTTVT